MPRPQFTLRSLLVAVLWWMTVAAISLAYATGAFWIRGRTSLAQIHLDNYAWIVLAGYAALLALLWSLKRRLSGR